MMTSLYKSGEIQQYDDLIELNSTISRKLRKSREESETRRSRTRSKGTLSDPRSHRSHNNHLMSHGPSDDIE